MDAKQPPDLASQFERLLADPLTRSRIEEVERLIAAASAGSTGAAGAAGAAGIGAEQARERYWEPAARLLLANADSSARTAFVMHLIDEAMTMPASYERTNLAMEALRLGLLSAAEDKRFAWPSYRAALHVYDPFISSLAGGFPALADVERVFLDTNTALRRDSTTTATDGRVVLTTEPTDEEREMMTRFTAPQALPGLGHMIARDIAGSSGLCNLSTLSRRLHALSSAATADSAAASPSNGDFFAEAEQVDAAVAAAVSGAAATTSRECDSEKISERVRSWLMRLVDTLRVRLLIVNLAANLDHTSPLIKYRVEAVAADARSRGGIVTPELIEQLTPFEYPPPLLPRDDFFAGEPSAILELLPAHCRLAADKTRDRRLRPSDSEKLPPARQWVLLAPTTAAAATAGPMYVVLDYGYGVDRYLLLSRDKSRVELPPGSSPQSLLRYVTSGAQPTAGGSTIGSAAANAAMQHYRFIAYYTSPPPLAESAMPPRGMIHFDRPLPGVDLLDAAHDCAIAYMDRFIASLSLTLAATTATTATTADEATKRMVYAYRWMYADRVLDALRADVLAGDWPFEAGTESERVISQFELHFAQLAHS